jgi:hypothetical protein
MLEMRRKAEAAEAAAGLAATAAEWQHRAEGLQVRGGGWAAGARGGWWDGGKEMLGRGVDGMVCGAGVVPWGKVSYCFHCYKCPVSLMVKALLHESKMAFERQRAEMAAAAQDDARLRLEAEEARGDLDLSLLPDTLDDAIAELALVRSRTPRAARDAGTDSTLPYFLSHPSTGVDGSPSHNTQALARRRATTSTSC